MKRLFVIATSVLFVGCAASTKQTEVAEVAPPAAPVVTKMEKCMAKDRLKFAWDKSEEAAGYRVYYGPDLNQMQTVVDAGSKPEVKIKNADVQQGQLYYFAVTAYNKEKLESPKSDVVAVEICEAKKNKSKKM